MRVVTTIASGANTSSAMDIRRFNKSIGFLFPTMTQTGITFLGAAKANDTFLAVMNDAGAAVTATIASDEAIALTEANAKVVMAFNYIKIVTTVGNEGALRTIGVALK